jgi:N-acetyl-anhydromuramyl-L-alanine amidase AmpD
MNQCSLETTSAMKHLLLLSILLFASTITRAQGDSERLTQYSASFQAAYAEHPAIPRGLLEAVAWSQTGMYHVPADEPASCAGLPAAVGLFGLIADGRGYFADNLHLVADLSGAAAGDLSDGNVHGHILAFASALVNVRPDLGWSPTDMAERILALSALPSGTVAQDFARATEVFGALRLLTDADFMGALNLRPFPRQMLEDVFGDDVVVLSSKKVFVSNENVHSEDGGSFNRGGGIAPCYDYAADAFVQTPSCNYNSRNGVAVTAVTVHTIQGSYAGAISWGQNCDANVSYHYVIRRSDGQITQMLCEINRGWHVGSENSYTIGLEHEGWVTNSDNYTEPMYQASAHLVRDITNSGYGISAQRTSYFPWAATTNYNNTSTPGSCVRIKGHQHFPNQSHTDPGQYWNWDYYFKLLNPNTPVTVETAATGDFYDTGGPIGVYGNDERTITRIQPGGPVTVTFTQFDVENNWDYLYIYDGPTVFSPLIGHFTGTNSPGTVTSSGDALTFEFRSDCGTTAPGWAASWTSVTPDNIAPTVSIYANNWETENFYALYTENDNPGGSDLNQDERFSQILDFNGAKWRGNPDHGYLFDDFGQALPEWVQQSGAWTFSGSTALQTDESNSNTNLHIPVSQVQFNIYLYGFRMRIGGSGSNRRAGMHFLCSDATLENRGNSYFVYLRADADKVQIYRVSSDSWTLMTNDDLTVNVNTWYDVKVLCNSFSGEIRVYVNGAMVSSWTDPSPITTGNSISLRSAGCTAEYDDIRVYRNRIAAQYVNIGTVNDPMRYQNPDPSTPSCEIRSIIFDNAGNMSAEDVLQVNIDWTPPSVPAFVNDGTGADIDLTTSLTELSANWGASIDQHSGLARYEWSIGTVAGLTDVTGWTDNGPATAVTATGLTLTPGQWYYFNVRAENGAALTSAPESSNGQLVDLATSAFLPEDVPQRVFPNPTTGTVFLPNANGSMLEVLDATGRRVAMSTLTSESIDLRGMGVADGMYLLKVSDGNGKTGTARVILAHP